MEALRSIDQQQQALTKHAQVLTYQAAGFSHVHKTHFDHYKQRVISIFRTANSSMKASERELGFKLSLMSSSTSLPCSLPRKWSYGQNKSLRMHKNSAIPLCVGKCQLYPCVSSFCCRFCHNLRSSYVLQQAGQCQEN